MTEEADFEYDDSDDGCPNCDGGLVMICCDDLCRSAGYCLNNMNDSTCWRDCPHCADTKKLQVGP